MKAVYLSEGDVEKFKAIAEFLRSQGAERASGFVSSLILSWQLAEPVRRCHIDESAGLADVYDLDPHSRRVS